MAEKSQTVLSSLRHVFTAGKVFGVMPLETQARREEHAGFKR